MDAASLWPGLALAAAGLQVVRNAAQRGLTERLGVWGAAYVRFLYGLPFALAWTLFIGLWQGVSGGVSAPFCGWILLGAATQAAATGLLVAAMAGRAFAVATALSKAEILAAAALGVVLIGDHLSAADWLGAALGTAGVLLLAHVSIDRTARRAAFDGVGAGLLFAVAAVSYRAAAHAWGPEPWFSAAAALTVTLCVQTIGGAALLLAFAPKILEEVRAAWRPSLTPGAAGAFASALLFAAFALGPSVGAVKTLQLVDVLIAGAVGRRMLRETPRTSELIGGALVLAGAAAVLLS